MKRPAVLVAFAVVCGVSVLAGAAGSAAGKVPSGAKSPAAHASIIGGHAVSIAEFPWLAAIEGTQGDGFFGCTGAVVAPRVVLTAGHCVENLETSTIYAPSGYGVATGVANLEQLQRQNVSQVSSAVIYPGFSPANLHGDAGLLILAAPVAAPALPLASAADGALVAPQAPITIAGWGLVDPKDKEAPAELQAASTLLQDPAYCRQHSSKFYPFYSSVGQLCAVDPSAFAIGTCHGDSGGPAIARRPDGSAVEVGITSLGEADCSTAFPSVFTRVDRISAWVTSWIEAVEHGGPTPVVKVPKARLPRMSIVVAKYLSGLGLAEGFDYHFRKGANKSFRCERVEREKVKCGVSWYQGGNDYYGTITVYFALDRNTVAWNDRYGIHWVNDYCWFHSGHRQTCQVHTKRR